MGQFDVRYIIDVAVPALMIIYPITIVLILLNVIPDRYATKAVFRAVTVVTLLFSLPDFLQFIISEETTILIKDIIPLSKSGLGWVLPALAAFCISNAMLLVSRKTE